MRLLIVWPDRRQACLIQDVMEQQGWDVEMLHDGRDVLPWRAGFDVLLLHLCLPGLDGFRTGDALEASAPLCPPRILFVAPPEWCVHRPRWADCTVSTGISAEGLCRLISVLAQKPLPKLAAAQSDPLSMLIGRFLDELSFKQRMKGRAYAAWLLERMVPATPGAELPLCTLYADCAQAFSTTSAAVERCLRVAVESVFTQASLHSIERFFGATVDPERGKPTNRAFLMQASQQIRYSFTASLSPNKIEMHHSPAAPTSV